MKNKNENQKLKQLKLKQTETETETETEKKQKKKKKEVFPVSKLPQKEASRENTSNKMTFLKPNQLSKTESVV